MNKLRNIFMNILKDIKADYDNVPQDISQNEFKEQLSAIKAQSDAIQAEHPVTATDMADIVTSMFSGAADLDETETQMFFELSEHIMERMASGSD